MREGSLWVVVLQRNTSWNFERRGELAHPTRPPPTARAQTKKKTHSWGKETHPAATTRCHLSRLQRHRQSKQIGKRDGTRRFRTVAVGVPAAAVSAAPPALAPGGDDAFLDEVGRVLDTDSSRSRPLMSLCVVEYCRLGSWQKRTTKEDEVVACKVQRKWWSMN